MNKFLSTLCVLALASVILGAHFFSNNLLMELAASDLTATVIRIASIIGLLAVICTAPPRSLWLRAVFGLGAIFLGVVAGTELMSNTMHIFDALIYGAISTIFAVEALEYNEDELLDKAQSYHLQKTEFV